MLPQKLQSNVVLARYETNVEQIPIKFGGFYVIKMNSVQNYAVDKHTKISVEICISTDIQVKYRSISSSDTA